jgi:hypothetical protein
MLNKYESCKTSIYTIGCKNLFYSQKPFSFFIPFQCFSEDFRLYAGDSNNLTVQTEVPLTPLSDCLNLGLGLNAFIFQIFALGGPKKILHHQI